MFCIIKCFKILTVSALDHIVIEHDSKNRAIYPAKHNLDQWKEHTYNFDHDDIQNIQNYRSNKNGRKITITKIRPTDKSQSTSQEDHIPQENQIPHPDYKYQHKNCKSAICFEKLKLEQLKNHTLEKDLITTAYDCDQSTPTTIRPIKQPTICNIDFPLQRQNLEEHAVEVYRVEKQYTLIKLYRCSLIRIDSICKAGIWAYAGDKQEHKDRHEEFTSRETCTAAVKQKHSPWGSLDKVSTNVWSTKDKSEYHCRISSTKVSKSRIFRIETYMGRIENNGTSIQQSLTHSTLKYLDFFSRPIEGKNSVIVWFHTKIKKSKLILVSKTNATILGNLVTLLKIGIASNIRKRSVSKLQIELSNGLMLFIKNGSLGKSINFENEAISFANKVHPTRMDYIDEFNSIKRYEVLISTLKHVISGLCNVQTLNSNILMFLLNNFPKRAKHFINLSKSQTISKRGEAIVISDCLPRDDFRVIFSRKIGNNCFSDLPIIFKDNTIKFIDLLSRNILKKSPKIRCEKRDILYISKGNNYYLLSAEGTFLNSTLTFKNEYQHSINIDKQVTIPDTLFSNSISSYASILDLVEMSVDSLNEINDIYSNETTITETIIGSIGNVFSKIGDGSSSLIKSLGDSIGNIFGKGAEGISKTIDSTAKGGALLIRSTGDTFKEIATTIFPAISSVILWPIVIYLAYITIIKKNDKQLKYDDHERYIEEARNLWKMESAKAKFKR